MQPHVIQSPPTRRAIVLSTLAHALVALVAWWLLDPTDHRQVELVDIEVAPPPPPAEALPEEQVREQESLAARTEDSPGTAPDPAGEPAPGSSGYALDAGIDAAPDAGIDAAIHAGLDAPLDAVTDAAMYTAVDAPDPPDAALDAPLIADAGVDAADMLVALADAAVPDAADPIAAVLPDAASETAAAPSDAADPVAALTADAQPQIALPSLDGGVPPPDAPQVASVDPSRPQEPVMVPGGAGSAGSGVPAGSGSGADPGRVIEAAGAAGSAGAGAAVPGMTNEPAVAGATTTAGTAANLLSHFPKGHTTTVLIRFDRLRGTEWAPQAERLLRPMPDYRVLFGASNAGITDKLETIIISTPEPQNAAATTLVARTKLDRSALRSFLGAGNPVTWSTAKGGLLGKRGGKLLPQDARVFLSPFQGWFLLAQPADLAGLTATARGDLDTIEATGKLPAWLTGIRSIETESGDPRGPALVLTLALDSKRQNLGANDFGLGVRSFPIPERVSLAAEVVPQGWLVRGNMRFANDAAAAEFITAAETVRQRIADSRILQIALGKPAARAIKNLSFARTGGRVSYATSISIADMRAIMAVASTQLDSYFAARMPGGPAPSTPAPAPPR